MINLRIGISSDKSKNIISRTAVRAVIFKGNEMLFLKSNRGDYKLPGGGVDENEDLISALKREIKEETGYECIEVKEKLGEVIERKIDSYDLNSIFEMTSKYHLCIVDENPTANELTKNELELGLESKWLTSYEAIINNMHAVKKKDALPWVERELLVLQVIHKEESDLKK